MILTDDIREYKFNTILQPEQHKTYREYEALAALKYAFPEMFSKLRKAEAPDLQDPEGKIGVEVTWGGSPDNELITSESNKYSYAKEENRKRILKQIREHGGDRRGVITSYPLGTEEGDKAFILRAFQKKVKKADRYHERFIEIGLAITIDVPLSIYPDFEWGNWLEPHNNNKFDFVILSHWEGVSMYDLRKGEYKTKKIPKDDRCALKKLSRMTTEGIIQDDDPEWNILLQ